MKLGELAYLADENCDPGVVGYLRGLGWSVATTTELGLNGKPDTDVLDTAVASGRVVITHDRDFGTLAIAARLPVIGILYLRPGHISTEFTVGTIEALMQRDPDVQPPFILVARRDGDQVTIRIRAL